MLTNSIRGGNVQKFWVFLKVLLTKTILEEIDVPIDPTLVEHCHRLPLKDSSKKVFVKLNHRKDIHRILLKKSQLKNLKPESVHLAGETKFFINESLCLYYKKLWSKCKRLWSASHISVFWVRNGSLRIKLFNESVFIIPHNCDLEKLFPDNSLIEDKQLLIDFDILSCVNKYFKIKLHYYCFG